MARWLLVSLFLVGCAGSLAPVRRADGGWHLKCGPALAKCAQQADDLCKGRGYVVISGFSKRKLYGAELGQSQVEERQAELDVACADKRDELPTVSAAPAASVWKLPPRTPQSDDAPPVSAPVPPPPAASAPVPST
jgi:hypothetical protein